AGLACGQVAAAVGTRRSSVSAGQSVLLQPVRRRGGRRVMNPWLGMGSVLAVLGALLAGLRLWQRRTAPHPELVRKLLHMGMGLVTLTFPWVFDTAWPVLLLASASVLGLLALRL